MIELNVSLASNGAAKLAGYEQMLRFGYTKNRGVYRLVVTASGEWEGLTIRAFWHVPDGKDPASSLVVGGYVDVPASVTAQPGNGCITFEGSDGTKTVTSADLRYRVAANSGTEDGTEPEPGTPAWQAFVEAVKDSAASAEQSKAEALDAAEQAGASAQKAGQALSDTITAKKDALKAIGDKQTAATQAVDTARDKALRQVEASTEAAQTAASEAAASAGNADQSAQEAADSLQELKDGIANGNFKGEKGDKGDTGPIGPVGPKGDTGPQGQQGDPGPDNLVIITATASATMQGEYTPNVTYSKALIDIQANKAVMIKLDNVQGRYYIPYSSSNAEILASAGTVSGSKQSIELYTLKWTAQTNIITLTGTKEGCIADGGTAGQVLVKKSNESFDTEWTSKAIILSTPLTNTQDELINFALTGPLYIKYNNQLFFMNQIIGNTIYGLNTIYTDAFSHSIVRCVIKNSVFNTLFQTYYDVPNGGEAGQILAKKSNTNGDTEWIDPPEEIPEDYPQIREDVGKLKENTAALQKRQNVLVGSETGNPVSCDDAFAAPLCGLTVYGKSTQDGTPTPDAPVPIVSAGDGGAIEVTLGDGNDKTQTLTLPTPNGLPGIPVTSGGNYTDPQGQQWVCDEVDLKRGVKVQRVNAVDLSTCTIVGIVELAVTKRITLLLPFKCLDTNMKALCNKLQHVVSFVKDSPHFYIDASRADASRAQVFIPIGAKNPEEGEYILFYALATPIETPLTPAELAAYKALTAYGPDTVVRASDGAGIKLDYQRDVNIAIKRIEDAIASMT